MLIAVRTGREGLRVEQVRRRAASAGQLDRLIHEPPGRSEVAPGAVDPGEIAVFLVFRLLHDVLAVPDEALARLFVALDLRRGEVTQVAVAARPLVGAPLVDPDARLDLLHPAHREGRALFTLGLFVELLDALVALFDLDLLGLDLVGEAAELLVLGLVHLLAEFGLHGVRDGRPLRLQRVEFDFVGLLSREETSDHFVTHLVLLFTFTGCGRGRCSGATAGATARTVLRRAVGCYGVPGGLRRDR
jgi:hypothetical protein